MREVRQGDYYAHYKGGEYKVIGHARSTVDDSIFIVYEGADGARWARPIMEWSQTVTAPSGERMLRFTWLRHGPE